MHAAGPHPPRICWPDWKRIPDEMAFEVVYTSIAQKELGKLAHASQRKTLQASLSLKEAPFPSGKHRKKVQGFSFPCYRLRIDPSSDSFRLFYGIDGDIIYVLRIVPKKDADRIIKGLRQRPFPPG